MTTMLPQAEDDKGQDPTTELLTIAAGAWRSDPWSCSKERALASVIRGAQRTGWTAEAICETTDMSGQDVMDVLGRWRWDVV